MTLWIDSGLARKLLMFAQKEQGEEHVSTKGIIA